MSFCWLLSVSASTMLSSVEIAASWVALGLTGRAMGEFWCSFYCAIHPTPRGRPLRGAGCNSRPLLFPDLPFTPRSRYQPARWRWGSVGGPRAGFAVIFSPNSTPHPAGARCAAPDALRSKWGPLTSRSPRTAGRLGAKGPNTAGLVACTEKSGFLWARGCPSRGRCGVSTRGF